VNRKQKINLASQIVSRSLIQLFYNIFTASIPNGEEAFRAFQAAEQEGAGEQYLREQALCFPPEQRERFAQYFNIHGILEMKMVQRGKEILTALPTRIPEYLRAAGTGILGELDFVKKALANSDFVHRNTILATYKDEIRIYHQHADLIIGVYPDWRKDEAFADFVKSVDGMRYLPADISETDATDLAYWVLRQLSPSPDGNILDFDETLRSQILRVLQKEIVFYIRINDELSEAQKNALFENNAALLEYLGKEDEPVNAAFIALIYQTFGLAEEQSAAFLPALWKLGIHYARLDDLTDADYEALFRVFRFISESWEQQEGELSRRMGEDAAPFMVHTWEHLAKAGEAMWEWESALNGYRKIAAFCLQNDDLPRAEKALFDMVETLRTVFLDQNAVVLLRQILTKGGVDAQSLGLPRSFEIGKEARAALEVTLVNLLDDPLLTEAEVQSCIELLQTDAAISLANMQLGTETAFVDDRQVGELIAKIHDFHLQLPNAPDQIAALETCALQTLNAILKTYLTHYRSRAVMASLMFQIEALIQALLWNEAAAKTQLSVSQRLLKVIWNVLIFKQEFLNRYLGKGSLEIEHESRYLAQIAEMRNSVYAYLKHPDPHKAEALRKEVQELRSGEYPYWHKRLEKKTWDNPLAPSLAFHFFTKTAKGRKLLILSWQPEGHALPEEKFLHAVREVPEEAAPFFNERAFDFGDASGDAYRYINLFEDEEEEEKEDTLFTPGWETKFDRLFGDFLLGGKEFFRLSRWQRDVFEAPLMRRIPRLNLYCDHFLQLLPIELLSKDGSRPFGLQCNFSMVLHHPQDAHRIDFGYGVLLLSGVPEQLNIPHLPYAEQETTSIYELLHPAGIRVVRLHGNEATKEGLESALERHPAVVHFSVHGIADPALPPETSALLLAPGQTGDASCLLTYQDILLMNWSSVKLVVLSACNAAVGKTKRGSPIQGLAYAFLSKGVQYVVASRSPVSDRSAAEIMTRFYHYLLETDVTDAMRLTRKWFNEHPDLVSKKDMASWGIWT